MFILERAGNWVQGNMVSSGPFQRVTVGSISVTRLLNKTVPKGTVADKPTRYAYANAPAESAKERAGPKGYIDLRSHIL